MPNVILQVYPSLGDAAAMEKRRPIGRDNVAVQGMLDGLIEVAQAADELGYWAITHVEHHFHSEGLEYSPAPLLFNVWLGAQTKRLRHGQLGLVLTVHDPIRLAEEIALADHLLKGRLIVGLARGYQSRWMSVLGQKFDVGATLSDQSEVDRRNRELFQENFRIMKLAWASELLQYKGPTYEVPFPYESGVPGWPPADTITRPYGVPGEVDANGTVRGVSVVPKPYSQPHPQLFQAFGGSPATLTWCGEEDVTPTIFAGPIETLTALANFYIEGAASRGRAVKLGEGIGICRTFHIVETGERTSEATVKGAISQAYEQHQHIMWHGWYEQFGALQESLRLPGEEGPVPAPGERLIDRLLRSKIWIAGTVDQVKRDVEALLEAIPCEYLVWLFHWGIMPRDVGLRQLELFATEIMPEFGLEDSVAAGAAPRRSARVTTGGRLAGKTAVITGATGGMGRVACRMFLAEGASVVGSDIDEEAGRQLERELQAAGPSFDFCRCDVSSSADVAALAAHVRTRFEQLDVLYNNAGAIVAKPARRRRATTSGIASSVSTCEVRS